MRLKPSLTLLALMLSCLLTAAAQAPPASDPKCLVAPAVTQLDNYCSNETQYSTSTAQPTTWISFVPLKYDITIKVTGQTLVSPTVELFSDCTGTVLVGSSATTGNVTTYYRGGLTPGNTYFIAISGSTPGTFQLCMNNYNPVLAAGQDCATASFLCSTQTFSQFKVTGAGNNNNEAGGTCLGPAGSPTEQNCVWYKWRAANNGTLVFTITPDKTDDDIDWVLYDLDLSGDCINVNAAHAIRCAAGSGVQNKLDCPNEPVYYKTGLDFAENDLTEAPGCGQGQNGKVKFVTLQQGHYYALLVNNYISQNNGFTMEFKDQHGIAGTAIFAGPTADATYEVIDSCTTAQQFKFTNASKDYAALKWNFGTDASQPSATGEGPYTVQYHTNGIKTITVEAATDKGCVDVFVQQIKVALKPYPPVITVNKPVFCLNDTLILEVSRTPGYTYHWNGPLNFSSDSAMVKIPVTSKNLAGTYTVTQAMLNCMSDPQTVVIPPIFDTPIAAFSTQPALPAKLSVPVDIRFFNQSVNSDAWLWDFGDGSTSTDRDPVHHYADKGTYKIKLTAFKQTACSTSVLIGDYVLLDGAGLYIPNAFTPNGDGINDEFVISLTNLSHYHIAIYNRWGKLLFETNSIFTNWDGSIGGKPAPVGVYYYVLDAADLFNRPIKQSGYVSVIR